VKSIAYGQGKAKDQKDGQSYGLNVDPRLFYRVSFSRSMASYESMPHMSRDHGLWVINDGNHVIFQILMRWFS